MKKNLTKSIGFLLVVALWAILVAAAWLKPSDEISVSERRKLAQFPTFSSEALLSGDFVADFEDYTLVSSEWDEIVAAQRGLLRSTLQGTKISVAKEGGIEVLFRNEFNCLAAERQGREKELQTILRERFNKNFKICFRSLKQNEPEPVLRLGPRIPGINMDIEMPEEED